MTSVDTIHSERLDLIPMTPEFLQAALDGDQVAAEKLIRLSIPAEWFEEADLIRLRLGNLRAKPELQPWILRAVGLRSQRRMVGHIGFHTAPGPHYLSALAPGAVEYGYTVFEADRRKGYAREAALALMAWARTAHGVSRFILSISPDNLPSLNLAQQLGFHKIAVHVDDEDGPEDIFELRFEEHELS